MLLEICANSVQSAINAERGGADRIELCRDLSVGGVTPLLEELKKVKEQVSIPVFVLVRLRGGDFTYSQAELDEMETSIRTCKAMGFEGVVIGALTQEFEIDMVAMRQLTEAAKGMSITFHRAFDEVKDHRIALEKVKQLGCHRILTSGLSATAMGGIEVLKDLVAQSAKDIIIMPGGSVRPGNIAELKVTQASEFHSSCIPKGGVETDISLVKALKTGLL